MRFASADLIPRFNSRTLGRVRRQCQDQVQVVSSVSIHAPWEGCDLPTQRLSLVLKVSIHAPWEGCDSEGWCCHLLHCWFQFTHPGKGATPSSRRSPSPSTFQFTHPGKGATESALHQAHETPFQFTHPGKGATGSGKSVPVVSVVSIHAPWEGCDPDDIRVKAD